MRLLDCFCFAFIAGLGDMIPLINWFCFGVDKMGDDVRMIEIMIVLRIFSF